MGTRIKKLRENEYARRRQDHNIDDIIYMVVVCAVFDYFLQHLLIFVLITYCGQVIPFHEGRKPRSVKQQSTKIETNIKIHTSMKKGLFPPYIRDNEKKLVRSVIDSSNYSIKEIKDISIGLSVRKLRPDEKMICQFFNESYPLEKWNYKREVSENDQKYLLYVIAVYYEPLNVEKGHETFDSMYKLSSYKPIVLFSTKTTIRSQ